MISVPIKIQLELARIAIRKAINSIPKDEIVS